MIGLGIGRPAPVEVRSGDNDALLVALLGGVGSTVTAAAQSGVQTAAGIVARALAGAGVEGDGGVLDAPTLEGIGTDMVRAGQALALFRLDGCGPRLLRAGAVESTVLGSGGPASWRYQLSIGGPSTAEVVSAGADEVVHVRWNTDSYRPWRGIAPLTRAAQTGRLAYLLTQSLGEEAATAVATLLPIPEGSTKLTDNLRAALAEPGNRRILFPETTHGGWGTGRGSAPQRDWIASKTGPEILPGNVELAKLVEQQVLAACGVPAPLAAGSAAAGPSQREAWRQLLAGTVEPLARLIEAEVSRVLESPVSLRFDKLAGVDAAGRARAVHVLAQAGVPQDDALAMVGWD